MNHLQINLEFIQHVVSLNLELNLSDPGLMCLVGRNGTGKTTLVRALRNLSNADTFLKTATPHAFSGDSRITYTAGQVQVVFSYDEKIRSLNCRHAIPKELRGLISAELPMPHGRRFNYFQSASEADLDIRKAIALNTYRRPMELIDFLKSIYGEKNYSNLIEVKARGKIYYAIVKEDGTYIREDYLSSGEYFLINLYRTIKGPSKLLVIDEIDLSLDAAAQAHISSWLRAFCTKYNCKILFTTHSLALMKKLETNELFYLDEDCGKISINPTSYSYAKARLFGFSGWDKYILTEDQVLQEFIRFLIEKFCPNTFFRYKIIFIGGGSQVVALMKHNHDEHFLSSPEKVISILDGDQSNEKYSKHPGVHMIPMQSIEKSLFDARSQDTHFPFKTERQNFTSAKDFHNHIKEKEIASQKEIFQYLTERYDASLEEIVRVLSRFLTHVS